MKPKTLALALFVSAALNLFFLGLVGRRVMAHREHRDHARERGAEFGAGKPAVSNGGPERPERPERPGHPLDEGSSERHLLRELVDVMGGPKDKRVQAAWSKNRARLRDSRREIREAKERVHLALTRDPFDRGELTSAMDDLRSRTSQAQEEAQQGVLALAAELSVSERAELKARAGERKRRLPPPGPDGPSPKR